MPDLTPELLTEIRARFAHVETCPFEGERVFFENAGGALTLNSVVETSARLAAIPDNQGRDNGASRALQQMIDDARADMQVFFNTPDRNFFVGESGTELLFRLIRAACLGTPAGR
ncbi:MAG: nitrogen fixation protein NifS, partial [Maritimibacter sp.]|nr:nitrogen fixation protein NifS [Maritimibacter sp.]